MSLMLHCGASHADRIKVLDAPTPEPTDTHFPIPHALLLESVEDYMTRDGLRKVNEEHSLTPDGSRYFGLLELESEASDYGLVLGLRNTHDRSFAASLAMGNRVFVCDNLSFSGEVLVGRRHTRHIERDLPKLLPKAFGELSVKRMDMVQRIRAYKGSEITDETANDLVVRSLVDEMIFPASYLPRIVQEWRRPTHDEFSPRTLWSLLNAFTEAAKPTSQKRANLFTLANRTKTLQGFFDKQLISALN